MKKCLYCYRELGEGESDFHQGCSRKMFGKPSPPQLPYTRDKMSELAAQVIRSSASVTGVQAKLSLDIDRGKKNEPDRFTIVGLWGNYILKPQSARYNCLPELEDLTMKMADVAGIRTADHSLIRFMDGELGYITKRMDRGPEGEKYSMLDMCQLSNRLTEHKYMGTYVQLAETIRKFSEGAMLDVQRFWEMVLFSWITGNSDMHCKNFSLLKSQVGPGYVLSPAYDMLAVLLADSDDTDELALPLETGGMTSGFSKKSFISAFTSSGIPEKVSERMISKMKDHIGIWSELIEMSFLPEHLKFRYKELIAERCSRL